MRFEKGIEIVQDENRSGMRRLPPKSLLGLDRRNKRRNRGALREVGLKWKWPQEACTTMFFLIPKNATSEIPIAHMPALIRWWEALRAPEVAKWQQKCRVDLGATDGRNGGVQQTVRVILMKIERFKYRAGEEDQGAVALVLDLAKALERVSLPGVWAWTILRVLCG